MAICAVIACGGGGGDQPKDAPTQSDAPPTNPSVLDLTPSTHDFGIVVGGQQQMFNFTLTNNGTGSTGAITIKFSGANAGDFSAGTCTDLAPGASCMLPVTFMPSTSAMGARQASLDITAAGGGSASSILQGTAQAPVAHLTMTPANQACGTVVKTQQSAQFSFIVTNDGNTASGPLNIITLTNGDVGEFAIEFAAGDCQASTTIAAQSSCLVHARFKPVTVGNKQVDLVVSGSPGGTVTSTLTGIGVDPTSPALSVLPTSKAFGTIMIGSSSSPTLFDVTNNGGMDSSTISVISSNPKFVVSMNNCTFLMSTKDCTFQVTYTSTIASSDTGTITVQATNGGTLTISVTGSTSAVVTTTVNTTGAATGSIVSTSPTPGFTCTTGTCMNTVTSSPVALTATPGNNSAFKQWSPGGACTGTNPTCSVTMDGNKSTTAEFVPAYTLNVTAGTGGQVKETAPGTSIDCGVGTTNVCTHNYPQSTMVTLTAYPASNYRIASWTGCTSSSGVTCNVTMDSLKNVSATFQHQWNLTIVSKDLGVTSGSSINLSPLPYGAATATCASSVNGGAGTTCIFAYDDNVAVTITQSFNANTTSFSGWANGCSGQGGCSVNTANQNTATTVTGSFASYQVSIAIIGNGKVGISPTTSGALCPDNTCTPTFPAGTMVTLTPQPSAGNAFYGWTAGTGCSGSGPCNITMSSNVAPTAEFRTARTLNVSTTGQGSVSSNPTGIDCGTGTTNTCSTAYANGTSVTLTATPSAGFVLGTWTGCTPGAGNTCTVTMNALTNVSVSFNPGTDLVITNWSCNPTITGPGSTPTCSLTVKNNGTVSTAGGSTATVVLSTDTTITVGDTPLTTCAINQLAAGASQVIPCSGTIPGGTASAAYYEGVVVDGTVANPSGVIPETDENNNTASVAMTVQKPDITVQTVACSTPVQPGTADICMVTFANSGPAIGAFNFELRFSTDTTITNADTLVSSGCSVSSIAANSTAMVQCTANLGATMNQNYLGAIADTGNAIIEADENNNTGSQAVTVGSDLAISALNCTTTAAPGGAVSCSFMVTNSGVATPVINSELRISTDTSLSTTVDAWLGSCQVPALASGATTAAPVVCNGTIPSSQAVGIVYLGVMVDSPDSIAEWDTSNNNATSKFVTHASTGNPDLIASNISCTPDYPIASTTISCTVDITNQGAASAGISTTQLLYGTTSSPTTGITAGSCTATPALAAGATTTVTCTGNVGAGTGLHYAAGKADSGGAVTETPNDNNNTSLSTSMTVVGTGTDLIATSISCPSNALPNATISCDVTIENHGTVDAGAFFNTIVYATGTSFTKANTPNAACNSTGVVAGGSQVLSCPLTLTGATAGARYIGIVVDSGPNITESDETNNNSYTPITIGASTIDLTVSAFTCAPSNVAQGANVVCSGTIKNLSGGAAAATTTTVLLGGSPVATCSTPAIAGFGSATIDCMVPIAAATPLGNNVLTMSANTPTTVTETSTANNTKTFTVAVLNPTTDLVATAVNCSGDGINATCTATVFNQGAVASPMFTIDIRQSATTPVPAASTSITTCAAPDLGVGETRTFNCTGFALSSNAAYVGAFVDSGLMVTEANEGNNSISSAIKLPNLTALVQCYATSTTVFKCDTTITNTGNAASAATNYVLRGSTNNIYETTDAYIGTAAVPALTAAGGNIFTTLTVPGTIYNYYAAKADATQALDTGVLYELNEGDNTNVQQSHPDLQVNSMTCSAGTTSCSVTLFNGGLKSTTGTFNTAIYLATACTNSGTATPCTGTPLGFVSGGPIANGATLVVNVTGLSTLANGTRYYSWADYTDVVTETDETNNTGSVYAGP